MNIKLSTTQKNNLNFLSTFLIGLVLMVSAHFIVGALKASTDEVSQEQVVKCTTEESQGVYSPS